MKKILAFIFVLISISSFAKGLEWTPEIRLTSSEIDSKLDKNESQYIFKFINITNKKGGTEIIYSIDSTNLTGILDTSNNLYIKSLPGIHVFQFYYNDQHLEIYSDSLKILPQYTNTYHVQFQSSEIRVVVSKPVIYLYPEAATKFLFKVNPVGEFVFTYPIYNNGWNGIAHPNGDIKIDNKTFNYLFWESDQSINLNLIDIKKGAIVKGSETLTFLEKQLDDFGFTTKEKADFITYWVPQLQVNDFNYIHFVLNDAADIFAELKVTPTPDNIYRCYMLSSKIENPNDFYYLEPQLIESIDRKGFTVLEWGGSKIDINIKKLNHRSL